MSEHTGLNVRPLQWAALPDLAQAAPLDAGDRACLEELRAVLRRHGRLDRFPVHLAHQHFPLGPDEILIEQSDRDGRTQHVTVGRLQDWPEAVPTTWLFGDGPVLRLNDAVYCVCTATSPYALGACVVHGKSKSPGEAAEKEEAVKQRRIAEDKAKYEQGGPVAGHNFRIEREG